MSELHRYEVGKLYSPTRTRWPEAAEFNYRQGANELRLFFGTPSNREIDAVRKGAAEFALLPVGDVLFFLYRFGDAVSWSDAPYSWHLVARQYPDQVQLPEPLGESEEARDLLQVVLVDAQTGIIRALRTLTFSPSFTAALRLAIRDQAARPWPGDREYDRQHQAAYQLYPSSQAMLAKAIARTVGGA